jgi:hypothetical protein
VIIDGFHVSGMLAMFDKIGPDLQAALDMGSSRSTISLTTSRRSKMR